MYIFRMNFLLLCRLCSLPHSAIILPVKCQCLHRLWLAGSTHACSHKGCSPTGVERLFTFGSSRMTVLAVRASAPGCMLGQVTSGYNCSAFWFFFKGVFLKSTLKKRAWNSVYVNEKKLFARCERVQSEKDEGA